MDLNESDNKPYQSVKLRNKMKTRIEEAAFKYSIDCQDECDSEMCSNYVPEETTQRAYIAGVEFMQGEVDKLKALEAQLAKSESVLKYYANGVNYSLDSYEGISGEMRSRVVLYGDSTEINDVASHAGRRAREYFESKEIGT